MNIAIAYPSILISVSELSSFCDVMHCYLTNCVGICHCSVDVLKSVSKLVLKTKYLSAVMTFPFSSVLQIYHKMKTLKLCLKGWILFYEKFINRDYLNVKDIVLVIQKVYIKRF